MQVFPLARGSCEGRAFSSNDFDSIRSVAPTQSR